MIRRSQRRKLRGKEAPIISNNFFAVDKGKDTEFTQCSKVIQKVYVRIGEGSKRINRNFKQAKAPS